MEKTRRLSASLEVNMTALDRGLMQQAWDLIQHNQQAMPVDARDGMLSHTLRHFIEQKCAAFPWSLVLLDWTGALYQVGQGQPHWGKGPLYIVIKHRQAAQSILSYNAVRFLDHFLQGDVDLAGNLYLLPRIRQHVKLRLKIVQAIFHTFLHKSFQTLSKAKVNVKSHYDIPQEVLNVYLDRKYMAYSCGMFEQPECRDRDELVRAGQGEQDTFDSLEKAQWRKFKDAVDFINPQPGETLLDVGCGYGGQLVVALEHYPFGKVVGWTHSANQVREGETFLAHLPHDRWEIHQGDYRGEHRVFDHVTSTGMISHVGPRGLVPYVRNIRQRIKARGRYLHHALMTPYSFWPQDWQIGRVFNKKYVWPGFHWFTLGTHVKALEENGFEIKGAVNLSLHYAKTTAAWYERMMQQREVVIHYMGEPSFRAWQIFLAGVTEDFLKKGTHVYRLYCEAV